MSHFSSLSKSKLFGTILKKVGLIISDPNNKKSFLWLTSLLLSSNIWLRFNEKNQLLFNEIFNLIEKDLIFK